MGGTTTAVGERASDAPLPATGRPGASAPGRRLAGGAAEMVLLRTGQFGDEHSNEVEAAESRSDVGGHYLLLVEQREAGADTMRQAPARQVLIDAAALAEQCPRWRHFCFRTIAADHGLAAVVRSHLATLVDQAAHIDQAAADSMNAVTVGLVAALLNSLDAASDREPAGLPAYHRRRIKEFVLNNLCNPLLDVDMIASAVGLSTRYVHHLFADEPVSLMQWIITKRLTHCRGQLVDHRRRHWKISQIAYGAGFNDLAHFSRSFRKHFNVSPSQLRAGAG